MDGRSAFHSSLYLFFVVVVVVVVDKVSLLSAGFSWSVINQCYRKWKVDINNNKTSEASTFST
jgi:hypothetical protein